jgi:heme iron utilization protein
MSSSSIRKHAGTGATSDQPAVPEPSFAERARTLVYLARIGSLSTLSRKQPGFPFGSVMPYGLDEHGRPIFLISTMAWLCILTTSGRTHVPACLLLSLTRAAIR